VSAAHMVEHSLIATMAAPLLVLAWRRVGRPVMFGGPVLAWSAFVLAQWVFHLTPLLEASQDNPALHAAEHLGFLAVGVWFWLPVLGVTRLADPERALYLFLAAPAVDLVGVALMVRGDGAAGVAMLAGTLPIAAAAGIVTWQWLAREQRQATAMERARGAL
jgi:cytochrome c oxidase assembly factor CtaG